MNNISMIIVNYNTADHLYNCLASIYSNMPSDTEVVVVDNASSDGSSEMVKRAFPQVTLVESKENLGFGLGNNLGVEHATREYIMLFNSDAMLQMDSANALLGYLSLHPEVSCVAPRVILHETRKIQPKNFGSLPDLKAIFMQSTGLNRLFPKNKFFSGVDGDHRWAREMHVGWVSGVCMMMRRDQFILVGGFDKRFFMYCEDIELCMKLSKLGKIVLLDDFDVVHICAASSKTMEANIRISLWQQRNLLMIIRDNFSFCHYFLSKLIIGLGLLIRAVVASVQMVFAGSEKIKIEKNITFRTSLARLKDIFTHRTAVA